MKYIRFTIFLFSFQLVLSCTGLKVRKSDLHPINESFTGTFFNDTLRTEGRFTDKTMLEVFRIKDQQTDSVSLKFLNSRQMQIAFGQQFQTKTYDGKFRNGYFQIFLQKKQFILPPIFMYRDIYRLRITLTKENDLLIANMWAQDGMILLLAGGDTSHRKFYFTRKFQP